MPLGKEVDLGPSDIVLEYPVPPPQKGDTVPFLVFGACLLWPHGRPSQLLLSAEHLLYIKHFCVLQRRTDLLQPKSTCAKHSMEWLMPTSLDVCDGNRKSVRTRA